MSFSQTHKKLFGKRKNKAFNKNPPENNRRSHVREKNKIGLFLYFVHTMQTDIIIVEHKISKWLVLSSLFFTIPSVYAFAHKMYLFSILLAMTSIVSANYWRKATYSWRRNMDLVFAKISFVVFVFKGVQNVNGVSFMVFGYGGLVVLLYCYYLSEKLFAMKNEKWYKFHMVFHFIMMCEQLIILKSIVSKNC